MKKLTLRILANLAICAFVVAACAPVKEIPTEALPVEEPPMIDEVVEEEMPELAPDLSLATGSQAVITRENAGDLKQIEYVEKGSINNMAWSPLGSPIALATTTGIYLVDPQTYQEGHFTKTAADHIAFSPDGTYLASTQGSRIILNDLRSESEPRVIEGDSDIYSIAFSPTENLLASASYDGTIKVWDLVSGEERASLDKTGSHLHDLAFSRDGQILASAAYLRESDHSEIIFWDVDNAVEILPESKIEAGAVLAVSPTSETIATGGFFYKDVPLRLLDFNGQVRLTLDEESEWVRDLIFSPDGKILASIQKPSAWDTTLKMWDTASGELLHTLDDEGEFYLVSFSPDQSQIAAASVDRVKLWDVEGGQDIAVVTDKTSATTQSCMVTILPGHLTETPLRMLQGELSSFSTCKHEKKSN